MKPGALLLVDVSNTMYRASAAYADLTAPTGEFTGGLYGILAMVTNAILRVGARHVVFCKDSGPYLRSMQFPDYKKIGRDKKDPALEERVKVTKQHLPMMLAAMRVPVWELPGYEADDLFAVAAMTYRNRYERIVGMTNDSDVGQLYQYPNFHVYDSRAEKGEAPYKSLSDLVGVAMERSQATMLVDMLALSGTHNSVPGLDGIGPVRSLAIVSSPTKWAEHWAKHQTMIERNQSLIELPHPNLLRRLWAYPVPEALGKFDARALYRWSIPYGINPTSAMVEALQQVNR